MSRTAKVIITIVCFALVLIAILVRSLPDEPTEPKGNAPSVQSSKNATLALEDDKEILAVEGEMRDAVERFVALYLGMPAARRSKEQRAELNALTTDNFVLNRRGVAVRRELREHFPRAKVRALPESISGEYSLESGSALQFAVLEVTPLDQSGGNGKPVHYPGQIGIVLFYKEGEWLIDDLF